MSDVNPYNVSRELVVVGGSIQREIGFLDSLNVEDSAYPELRHFSIAYFGKYGMVEEERSNRILEILTRMPQLIELTMEGQDLEMIGKTFRDQDQFLWNQAPFLRRIISRGQKIFREDLLKIIKAIDAGNIPALQQLGEIIIEGQPSPVNPVRFQDLDPRIKIKI